VRHWGHPEFKTRALGVGSEVPKLLRWSRTDSSPSVDGALRVPYNMRSSAERCTSQTACVGVHVVPGMLKCSCFCCAVSDMKEYMQVLARGGMRDYEWSLYFQKWCIVLGINGKLDHPVIACNCIPGEYTECSMSSGTGLCFLR